AAVGAVDLLGVPGPRRVLVREDVRKLRRQEVAISRRTLRVVPDHQLTVDDGGLVALGARPQRHPPRVRDLLALAVATPAPVVERAGDVVALDLALGEVAAHVSAEAVEHVELALAVLPDHELGAEAVDRVRLAVLERLGEAETVPPSREAQRRR